jgi:hypothetical protein
VTAFIVGEKKSPKAEKIMAVFTQLRILSWTNENGDMLRDMIEEAVVELMDLETACGKTRQDE